MKPNRVELVLDPALAEGLDRRVKETNAASRSAHVRKLVAKDAKTKDATRGRGRPRTRKQ